MKKLCALSVSALIATSAMAADIYSNFGGVSNPSAIGLSTGNVTASGVAAAAGLEWSELQSVGGAAGPANTSAGFSVYRNNVAGYFRLADDFTVQPGEQFTINELVIFPYATGTAANTNPFVSATLRVWNGAPGAPGSSIIYGDDTTNALLGTTDTNLRRIFNTVVDPDGPGTATPPAPGTTRIVRQSTLLVADLVLGPGTYWLDWQINRSSTTSAVFYPSITIPGQRGLAGWNGRQLTATGWTNVLDTGIPEGGTLPPVPDVAQDFPFILRGTYIPEPASLALLGLGALLIRRR